MAVASGRWAPSIAWRHAKFLLGLFEQPYVDPVRAGQISKSADPQMLALNALHQAIMLLKNDGALLPLKRSSLRSPPISERSAISTWRAASNRAGLIS
jgi:beta-glucosidase-like glycosyl hydrolase